MGSYSGVFASSFGPARGVLEAWVKWANAHGGIDGHQLNLIVKDDAGNPTAALADVKELVQQDHVIALVGELDASPQVWGNYIASTSVPVVGGLNNGPPWNTSPDFFTTTTSYTAIRAALGDLARQAGAKSLGAISCSEVPDCAEAVDEILAGGRGAGLTATFSQLVSSTASEYTAACLAAKSAGVGALGISDTAAIVATIMSDCAAQGYDPKIILQGVSADSSLYKTPGIMVAAEAWPSFITTGPGKDFNQALTEYDPGASPNTSYASMEWGAYLLLKAAASTGKLGDNPTPADVFNGLYAIPSGDTLGGFVPPLHFVRGKPTLQPCFFTFETTKNGPTTANGATPTCPGT